MVYSVFDIMVYYVFDIMEYYWCIIGSDIEINKIRLCSLATPTHGLHESPVTSRNNHRNKNQNSLYNPKKRAVSLQNLFDAFRECKLLAFIKSVKKDLV